MDEEGSLVLDCTKPNSILFECEYCGERFNQAFEPADEHTFIEGVNIVGYKQKKAYDSDYVEYGADEFDRIATCSDYYVIVECDIWFCGATHEYLVEGTGKHEAEKYLIDVAPTCTEPGRKLYNCKYCGYYQDVTVPATGHSDPMEYVKTLVEPTCTTAGVRLVKCTNEGCDYTEEQPIPALGHHWVYSTTEADCQKGIVGRKTRRCVICGAEEVVDEWTGHVLADPDDIVAHKDPTCTEEGSISYWCDNCHKLVTETTPALNHEQDGVSMWTEIEKIDATCKPGKESGTIHKYECKLCGETKTEVDDDMPEGHTMFDDKGELNRFVVKVLPTCEASGVASYVCSVCGTLIEDYELAPISHNTDVTFNEETGAYEITCLPLLSTDIGRLHELLVNAGYDEKVAKAVVDMMARTGSEYFAGIGCDYVESIEVVNTEYTVTSEGNRGYIELVENAMPLKSEPYVRITWRYTQANGDSVSFVICRSVDEDGSFKLSGLSVPSGWICDFIYAEVVSNPDADELNMGSYAIYGSAVL